jgi:hypothetical protein
MAKTAITMRTHLERPGDVETQRYHAEGRQQANTAKNRYYVELRRMGLSLYGLTLQNACNDHVHGRSLACDASHATRDLFQQDFALTQKRFRRARRAEAALLVTSIDARADSFLSRGLRINSAIVTRAFQLVARLNLARSGRAIRLMLFHYDATSVGATSIRLMLCLVRSPVQPASVSQQHHHSDNAHG